MHPDPDTIFQYLDQTRQLYGNKLFLEDTEQNYTNILHDSLDLFKESICNCQECPLGQTRNNFVFGVGNPQADIVFVGEAPGEK